MLFSVAFTDLWGGNGSEAQEKACALLDAITAKCDMLAVLYGSPWAKKATELMSSNKPQIRMISKKLHLGILMNDKRCCLVHQGDLRSIPEDFVALIHDDDRYLFQLYLTVGAQVLVTTDERLMDRLAQTERPLANLRSRSEFIREYLGK
jgi:hypothetical protein